MAKRPASNKRMQAARANAIWYVHSMLASIDKVPLLGLASARESDANRYAALRQRNGKGPT